MSKPEEYSNNVGDNENTTHVNAKTTKRFGLFDKVVLWYVT
jgi:hypothetical protein